MAEYKELYGWRWRLRNKTLTEQNQRAVTYGSLFPPLNKKIK